MKGAAKKLLERVEDKLVLDWKRRQQTRSAVRKTIGTVLDAETARCLRTRDCSTARST